jgi:flagellin
MKTKAIQAASDGQNTESRLAIQKDVARLMEELNIIATTTSFNGQKLLSGTYTDKSFQVGAYANETVDVSIASAQTKNVGHVTRADLSLASEQGGEVQLTLTSPKTGKELTLKTIDVQYNNSVDDSMGGLAAEINRYSGDTGITAKAVVESTADQAVAAGSTGSDFTINGVAIGAVNVEANDNTGTLLSAINSKSTQTGVTASLTEDGRLNLVSQDGRAIKVEGDVSSVIGATASQMSTIGHIELTQAGSSEFQISGIGAGATGADITLSAAVTTSKDSVLAAGSTIASGSEIGAGSTVGGDAQVLVNYGSSGSQLDTEIKAGSTIAFGSTIAAGTEIGGQMIVGSTTAGGSDTNLDQDMLVTAGSTLKEDSVLGKGTVVTTQFTTTISGSDVTFNVGDVLSQDVTLAGHGDLTLTANMELKDNTDANSTIAFESSINAGSVLGADFTVGIKNVASVDTLPLSGATTKDYYVEADDTITYTAANDQLKIAEGSLLKSGTVLTIDGSLDASGGNGGNATWDGPALVTTSGVINTGDTVAADTVITLDGDQVMASDLYTAAYSAGVTETIKAGSILKSGFEAVTNDIAHSAANVNELTGSTDMIVADDMTLKAGSNIEAGSTLVSGSQLGNNTYVYGNAANDGLSTYDTSDIKAGSTFENGTILGEGSTIGGSMTTSGTTTLDSDMSLKAGTTLKAIDGAGNTLLKAGTLITQDMVLNTGNDGTAANEVEVKAGDVLTTDLYLDGLAGDDGVADVTLSQDMMLKEDSELAAGTVLAVNTENSGTVGLSNTSFSNLSEIDLTTLDGAMDAIDNIAAAITDLDTVRSDLGSAQNQLVSTINNISVTQVNVKAAESQIRDVDFAAESAAFSKFNILAQSGSYAMSQANAVQQNVLRLLQ